MLLPLVVPLHLLALMLIYARAENRPHIRLILKAVRAAFAGATKMLAKRREIGRHRRASFWDIARAMTWNPRDLSGRRPVIRKLSPSTAFGGPPHPAGEGAAKPPEGGSDAPTPPPTRSGAA